MTEAATDEAGFAAIGAALATPSALLPEAPPEYTADTAKAKIAELKADKEFAERYLSGEVKATEEFKRLHGIASGKQAATESGIHRSMQFDALRKLAPTLPEKCFAQAVNNGPVAQFERTLLTRMLILGL